MTVLEARGLEVESQLAFSGLSDLMRPALDRLEDIPEPQSAALAGALGVGPPFPGDRFVVCVATLSLLAAAAEDRPVLAIVDDSHWVDEASREALSFAARRLEAEGVVLLIASLEHEPSAHVSGEFEELRLAGLDVAAASRLLRERVPYLIAPHVIEELWHVTSGNPLALIELATGLSEGHLSGVQELGKPLPPAVSVERAFLRRVERLPAETRQGVLVVAAGSGVTGTIDAACEVLGLPPTCLEAAEEAGVIEEQNGQTLFTHPLLRAAVYHAATTAARDRAHMAVADALGPSAPERRAWHLAAATREPDESVATALEAAAAEARGRAGYAAAAAGLEHAARLTPPSEQRATRLVEAARDWHLAGRPEVAARLLEEALMLAGDSPIRVEIQHLRGPYRHVARALRGRLRAPGRRGCRSGGPGSRDGGLHARRRDDRHVDCGSRWPGIESRSGGLEACRADGQSCCCGGAGRARRHARRTRRAAGSGGATSSHRRRDGAHRIEPAPADRGWCRSY